ncbi:Phenylalanyl-tRNA synthetase beta chain [Nitrospira tepida]|uniref:phenylalanine--tRNA ligase n=1 Tax=Nitrospira tepida TaxID=2973512 RepID=A0AA86MWJ0_9BACT|nr:phenylalanine--tRNA ligase subunit beta [Nitrospira tepida]CAI4030189.1 Phenylalanyl-tRNA synthetase beta chain [Nitrospira tepida]
MPTISVHRTDLESLIEASKGPGASTRKPEARGRERISTEQLEELLQLVKGEYKGQDSDTGEWRVELQDSNRPDLWCCEGIARQIRIKRGGKLLSYPFFSKKTKATQRILVGPGIEQVRPYVAACSASGYEVTEAGLAQLIQTQEKLADMFGRKRRTVSIGIYRLAKIRFPVHYELVKPDETRFTPLGLDTPMTLGEMLMVHPKGVEYGGILAGAERLPLLRDEEGQALSFPPIINSREIGEVQVGDRDLFVEVTGTDLPMVVLALNIFAVNLADRGARIDPVEVRYGYKTPLGKSVVTPCEIGQARAIALDQIGAALGQALSGQEIRKALETYGYEVALKKTQVVVKLPPYRNDVMHPVDVVEDVAISRGYGSFTPVMPQQFTVGGLSQIEQRSDRVRDLMVGLGYQEVMSNIMASRQELVDRMRLAGTPWERVVEVDNVMSLSYACLRQSLLPSLLRVEAASNRAFYPHRLFEVGELARPDESRSIGSRTLTSLGVLAAHQSVSFSEVHSALDLLLYYLGLEYELKPIAHPSFMDGRVGEIVIRDRGIGLIGEFHPEVLEQWQIGVPAAGLELDLTALAEEEEE